MMKCKFCEKHERIIADTTIYQNTTIENPEYSKVIIVNNPDGQREEEIIFSIKYCPYCGKKLPTDL